VCVHAFILTVWFQRERHEVNFWSMVKSEVENIMKARFCVLAMWVRVSSRLRDLLGVSGFAAAMCKWGRQHK
jgi:hypothetical protein